MVQTIVVTSPDRIADIVASAVSEALSQFKPRASDQIELIHHVDVKRAAYMEGVSVPMMRKIQSQYITKLVGSKRVFRVENGELVRKPDP